MWREVAYDFLSRVQCHFQKLEVVWRGVRMPPTE